MWRQLRKTFRRKTDPIKLLSRLAPKGLRLQNLVHVGAHLAQERHDYEAAGYRKMLWVEGSQEVHARLAETLTEHLAQSAQASQTPAEHQSVCALLTDREGDTLALREFSNDGMSSSIFAAADKHLKRWPAVQETGRQQATLTRTLDALLAELNFGPVDTLVVDVQGAELLVLKGAAKALSQVKAVVSEVSTQPHYEGGVLFDELCAFMLARGFEPMSVPRRHGDMLFVHPERAGFGP